MKQATFLLPLIVISLSCSNTDSPILEFPAIINDNMVLQQNTDVILWGRINPREKISITTSWGFRTNVMAENSGKWETKIKTTEAGGPFEIAFHTSDTSCTVRDVYLGEVWICSGQSNMEMPLKGWPPTDTILNSKYEIQSANYPMIRVFDVMRNTSTKPLDSCSGSWEVCSPQVASDISATAYFFGREIHEKLDVPIGLITTYWGGTPAEAWTPGEFVKKIPAYSGIVDSLEFAKTQHDSLLKWLNQLPKQAIDTDDNTFYSSFDYNDEELADISFDDSDWGLIRVPSKWGKGYLPHFNGVVWYRTRFEVPSSILGREMIVHLGPIDDMDVAYINGQKIGEIMEEGRWKEERNYIVPKGLLTKNENVLAVRVIDNRGGGGIYGSQNVYISDNAGNKLQLDSIWKYFPTAEIISNKIYSYTDDLKYSSRPEVSIPVGPSTSTCLYNAMIHPLVPYTIQGAIWYQGEANVGRGFEYRTLFPTMINAWRSVWDQGDFPFYYVQIAPYNYDDDIISPAAELREAQLMTLTIPNTGMVVTMDIGNPLNIHPANKQYVGKRLALWALAKDYGYDSLIYSGPLFKTISIEDNKAVVEFDHAEGGLVANGGALTHFEIAGEDKIYYPAKAVIEGNTIVVTSHVVSSPVAVRYGWSANAEPNLFNSAGLPASPFRTDDWKRLSE